MKNRKPPLFRPAHLPEPEVAARERLAAWRAKQAAAGESRPGSAARGYDAAWREVRALVLQREPHCRLCAQQGRIREAKMVDHIETIATRPDLRLEVTNLQPLCWPHHNAKTNRSDGGLGNAKAGRR